MSSSDPHDARPPLPPDPVPAGGALEPVAAARAVPVVLARRAASPLELRDLPWRSAVLDGTLVLTVTVLATYLPDAIAIPFLPEQRPALLGQGWLITLSKGVELLVAVVVAWYLVQRSRVAARSFGIHADRLALQILWIPVILVGIYAFMLLTAMVLLPWLGQPGVAEQEFRERMKFMGGLPIEQPLQLAALFAIVGLQEELVFRGLLLTYGRRVLGSWLASILACSVLFGLLHVPGQGLIAAVQITGLGVVLSLFFIATRSLLAVAVAHGVFNFLQTQLARYLPQLQEALEAAQPGAAG